MEIAFLNLVPIYSASSSNFSSMGSAGVDTSPAIVLSRFKGAPIPYTGNTFLGDLRVDRKDEILSLVFLCVNLYS
ncbi:Uncharacterised protein [Chlamydia trachomatis]|nr:Uncharacterised protein [Chlamydia trachomatis]